MKKTLIAALLFVSSQALAGEKLLGAIVSVAGADTTNASTASPFVVLPNAQITLWCNTAAFIITDTSTAASATTAIPVASSEKFPTSVSNTLKVNISGAPSAIVRIFGVGAVTCYVYARKGTE